MPPRTTRYCDGPRGPNRSVVGIWQSTATTAHVAPLSAHQVGTNKRCQMVKPNDVETVIPSDPARMLPWGLGCQWQRHRAQGRFFPLTSPLIEESHPPRQRRVAKGTRSFVAEAPQDDCHFVGVMTFTDRRRGDLRPPKEQKRNMLFIGDLPTAGRMPASHR